MSKYYAPGIKRKEYPGDASKLRPGMLVDFFVQHHDAKRRGPHYDFRLGSEKTKLFSWATNQHPLDQHEGNKIPAARTNLHEYSYGSFEGHIPPGYGHGDVKLDSTGKALITRNTGDTISFTTGDDRHLKRYTLVNPGDKYGKNYWIMLRQKTPDKTEAEKVSYKTIDREKIIEYLKSIPKDTVVQPKVDGSLQFIHVGRNKVESMSHRISTITGKPIVHTEKIFKTRPHLKIPKELRNSVLLGEVYGVKNGKTLPQQETSAILNSTLGNSIKAQREGNIDLKVMLFGVAKLNGENVDLPYADKREQLKKFLSVLPQNKFHLPEEATGPKEAVKLWKDIHSKKHDLTEEGLVVHHASGVPTKIKVLPEQDVYIRSFFPGEGKYKDVGVGGFNYSHTPNGPIVGKVGTGLNDQLRKLMHSDPKQFIGQKARVHSQGQYESGALRAPALINIHEG